MSQLVPCPSCERHVRSGEACPFCGSDQAIGVSPPPVRTVARLGRAAILAFGATLGAGSILSGCIAAYGTPAPPEPDAGQAMEDAAVAPAYGAPAPDGG